MGSRERCMFVKKKKKKSFSESTEIDLYIKPFKPSTSAMHYQQKCHKEESSHLKRKKGWRKGKIQESLDFKSDHQEQREKFL